MMRRAVLAVIALLATLVLPAGAAQAAVPANGIYEDHNGVLYSTGLTHGCRYSGKANVYSDGLARELIFLGRYVTGANCHLSVMVRLWHPTKGIQDMVVNKGPGQSGDVVLGKQLGPVGEPGWKFVFFHITVYPNIPDGISFNKQLGVVYDANPCINYPAVCNVVAGWRKNDGIVR